MGAPQAAVVATVLACLTITFAQGPPPGPGGAGFPGMGPMPAWAQGTDPGELFPRHHWGGAGGAGPAGGAPGGVNPFIPTPLRKAAIGMPPCRGWCHYQGENNYKFTQEQVIHMVKRLEKYSTCGIAGVSRWNCSTPGGIQRMWHQGLCYCKAYNNGRFPGEPKCVINECGGCAFDFFVRPTPAAPFERVICD